MRSPLADMGTELSQPVALYMDASAGLGIIHRRGAGRIRHIHTPALWLQRAHQDGLVVARKVDGVNNMADLGTKHEDRQTLMKLVAKCGLVALQGRSQMALKAALHRGEATDFECEVVNPFHYHNDCLSRATE